MLSVRNEFKLSFSLDSGRVEQAFSTSYSCFMCVRNVMRVLFCGLLRFFRTLTTLFWRVFGKRRQINMSDYECEYDSTWEDEHENKTPRKKMQFKMSDRNMYAAKDMQNFRHSCRDLDGGGDDDDGGRQGRLYNLEFYRGQIKSSPDAVHIDDFHEKWWGKYDLLEDVHSYIQWLFPIQEKGVNWRAHVLTKKEIKLFRKDKQVKSKLVKSYELMLDFYGLHLVNKSTGEVERASNWKERFRDLNRYTHNNLRITRILKCLGTLGLKHYQAPLVKFFLHETLVEGQLPNVKESALDYFMFAVLDKSERRELVKYAFEHFKPREHFVWGPKKIPSGQVVHYKKKNVDQPTASKQSRTAEDQQKRVNSIESTHEINKIDARHPPEEIENKKDHQIQDEAVIQNKLKETNDAVNGSHQTVEKSSCQVPDIEMKDETEDKESKDKQKRVNLNENKHEMKKIDANYNSEEMEIEKDHQNMDELVSSNKLRETKSDQGANESSQCRPENESVAKMNPEMSVGVDNDMAPANHSHSHDAVSGSEQNKEKSSCQVSEIEMKDETEDKESEDKQKRVILHESKHDMKKIDANNTPKEMESKKDHQNMDELVNSNKLRETKSDQGANESSQCRPENESVAKINPEMSVGVDNDMAPANKSHSHDAVSGSEQNKEKSSCQVFEIEMKDETEDKESEDKQKRAILHESKHGMKKIGANNTPKEMESKKDHQNMDELVSSNKLTKTKSDQRANESSQCRPENESAAKINPEMSVGVDNNDIAPANKSHIHDAVSGSEQNKEKSSCQVSEIEMKAETEDKGSEGKQKSMNLNESKHEMKTIDANCTPEEMESKKVHQKLDEPVQTN